MPGGARPSDYGLMSYGCTYIYHLKAFIGRVLKYQIGAAPNSVRTVFKNDPSMHQIGARLDPKIRAPNWFTTKYQIYISMRYFLSS